MEGVAMLCNCLEGTEEECTDVERASFEAECLEAGSDIGQTFVCMGGTTSCVEATEECL